MLTGCEPKKTTPAPEPVATQSVTTVALPGPTRPGQCDRHYKFRPHQSTAENQIAGHRL